MNLLEEEGRIRSEPQTRNVRAEEGRVIGLTEAIVKADVKKVATVNGFRKLKEKRNER